MVEIHNLSLKTQIRLFSDKDKENLQKLFATLSKLFSHLAYFVTWLQPPKRIYRNIQYRVGFIAYDRCSCIPDIRYLTLSYFFLKSLFCEMFYSKYT